MGGGDLQQQICAAWTESSEKSMSYKPPAEAMKWLCQTFLGLEHLHVDTAILHRDIKPDNIVFDSKGNAKIADFGFAKFGRRAQGPYTFGVAPGSPGYVAPEVLLQLPYGCSVDLYSYGVLLWVVLTGGLSNSLGHCHPPCADWCPPDVQPLLGNWQRLEEAVKDPSSCFATPSVAPTLSEE